jgi:very-short-patch-repair endonuclease
MIILSSLDIDGISNEGQRNDNENYYFWQYMRYARAISGSDRVTANQILRTLNPSSGDHPGSEYPESPFEIEVAEFLASKGYHVEYQVGESGFRIDLGIKRMKNDPFYLCGIECDGRRYHSSWNARLNDIWRQEILEGKGWRIIRVWSTEWFGNSIAAKQELINRIETVSEPAR